MIRIPVVGETVEQVEQELAESIERDAVRAVVEHYFATGDLILSSNDVPSGTISASDLRKAMDRLKERK